MSDDLLVQCCAPTLAGIKTGNLFSCPIASREELAADLRALNRELSPSGLRILPLRISRGQALLYLFRPARLQQDLRDRDARRILDDAGYRGLKPEQCILRLMKRLRSGEGFPHEIGLFLSYPPEDVRGFIDNKAQNYKFIGYWKVYGDESTARRTFSQYRNCTDAYRRSLQAGYGLSRLAVAI